MHSLWSGALSFGLVSIPIRLYSASKERALKFKLLSKHGSCPISYMKVCHDDNKEVPYDEIVKGFEYQKDDYVVLTDEDFKKVSPKKTQTIDIQIFCDEGEIDPTYYDSSYYIEPDKKSEKAYVLLREAMKRS